MNSVPVIIDDIKNYDIFQMSRCSYFTIESDTSSEGWYLSIQDGASIPFMMLGLQGIIYASNAESGKFESTSDIDELFELIESVDKNLFIDINDIWVPNFLFDGQNLGPGDVYRIDFNLFVPCFHFRNQIIQKDEFLNYANELRKSVIFSESETNAFNEWETLQIKEAILNYSEFGEEFALRYKDDNRFLNQ